tara:strand:+ start:179 stop:352 length:174 start_codon:yes stop_codon:yes gene_type:complete
MSDDYDFGGWLVEDLKDYREELLRMRSRAEMYSDRVELNKSIRSISQEIQSREERNL